MEYLAPFLEGIITFISPCLLPMLPIYITYFAGQQIDEEHKYTALKNAFGFVLGFTILFVTLGAFAGQIGSWLKHYNYIVNLVSGIIIIIFGLNYIEVIKIPFLNAHGQMNNSKKINGFFSSVIFGIVFSINWTPCVGAFLGTAIMHAANSGSVFKGILMLLSFSAGLGIPFVLSAVLINNLKSTFDFIKRHYRIINIISGTLLIILGILMATGLIGYFYSLF